MAQAGLPMRLDPVAALPRSRFAQASACSSRSLPQNNSPSAVVKLGAPNTPSCCAASVCARRRSLMSSDCAASSAAARIDIQVRQDFGECARLVDPAVLGELRAKDRDGEILAPALRQPDQRHARGQQAVLRKRIGPAERQRRGPAAEPLQVAPHVAALGLVEIERRGVPALRLEDRPEQERPKAHLRRWPPRPAAGCAPPPDRNRSRRNRTRNRGRARPWPMLAREAARRPRRHAAAIDGGGGRDAIEAA